ALVRGIHDITYPQGDTAEALSVSYSYPLWICEKFIGDFGFAFTKALLSYKADKGTAVRMNTLRIDTDTFIQALDSLGLHYTTGSIAHAYIIDGLSDIENMDIYQKGWIAVQSPSAMRAVLETDMRQGIRLLDCCAAPGGKSAYAAALYDNTLDITAWDIHAHRTDMTEKNFARLGVKNAIIQMHDASVFDPKFAEHFDVVIVDAPCSAMGLMAKSPDIRYARKSEDIADLSKKQHEILSTCARYLKTGGTLAYYTCSINKEENQQLTDRFINENRGFAYKKTPITLYPHTDHSDGFYIAVMTRNR
ncbi:MAG: hypothetical protein PHO15_10455, partial [Eubacteriales bacterium]|nr:hypothetical protein [Eubacteriales bacterium]